MWRCKKNLWIVGSGGLAKEVCSLFANEYNFKGYLDEDINNVDLAKNIFNLSTTHFGKNYLCVIAIGDPKTKQRLSYLACSSLIYKNSIIGKTTFDSGCIVFPNVTFTANNKVGFGCTIYQNCSISHDTSIGNCCNITPGVNIAGRCKIGNRVYLGIGCVISNDVSICDDVVIGAGAVVVDDIVEPGTYIGVPARKIK